MCFVLAGREPAQGVLVTVPPHTGAATLMFDLHNRHTYSDEAVRAGRGFAKYTAVVAVLTMTAELLGRGAVQSELRTAGDLYERISGRRRPRISKAVAPLGRDKHYHDSCCRESVSILGECTRRDHLRRTRNATPVRTYADHQQPLQSVVPARSVNGNDQPRNRQSPISTSIPNPNPQSQSPSPQSSVSSRAPFAARDEDFHLEQVDLRRHR